MDRLHSRTVVLPESQFAVGTDYQAVHQRDIPVPCVKAAPGRNVRYVRLGAPCPYWEAAGPLVRGSVGTGGPPRW